jgi:hypothetical protein
LLCLIRVYGYHQHVEPTILVGREDLGPRPSFLHAPGSPPCHEKQRRDVALCPQLDLLAFNGRDAQAG